MSECMCDGCKELREIRKETAELRREIAEIKAMMTPDELDRVETIMNLVREMDGK